MDTPLPISNREVKHHIADGTAKAGEQVYAYGLRRLELKILNIITMIKNLFLKMWQVAQPTAYQLTKVGKFVLDNAAVIATSVDIVAAGFQLGCGIPLTPEQCISLIGDFKTIFEWIFDS